MRVFYTKEALRDLKKFDSSLQRRIVSKITTYADSPDPCQFARKLKNDSRGEYRFRVGDYRIICDIKPDKMDIVAVGHRRQIYR